MTHPQHDTPLHGRSGAGGAPRPGCWCRASGLCSRLPGLRPPYGCGATATPQLRKQCCSRAYGTRPSTGHASAPPDGRGRGSDGTRPWGTRVRELYFILLFLIRAYQPSEPSKIENSNIQTTRKTRILPLFLSCGVLAPVRVRPHRARASARAHVTADSALSTRLAPRLSEDCPYTPSCT